MAKRLDGRRRLAEWMESRDLSQVRAAEIIGINSVQLNQILHGRRRPGLENAVRIQRETGIPVDIWAETSIHSVRSEKVALAVKRS